MHIRHVALLLLLFTESGSTIDHQTHFFAMLPCFTCFFLLLIPSACERIPFKWMIHSEGRMTDGPGDVMCWAVLSTVTSQQQLLTHLLR